MDKSPRLLVVRRDSVGDLVCTTPLLRALRARYPGAWIGVLADSHDAPVLAGHPDVDEVLAYTKLKHRAPDQSRFGILWRRLQMMNELNLLRLDELILAAPTPQPRSMRLARWLAPRRIVGFGDVAGLDVSLPLADEPLSEVEDVFRIARLHGIEGAPPPCHVAAPPGVVAPAPLSVAVHVGARKPSQRWPVERFAATMRALQAREGAMRFTLLWSPGDAANARHPGDDDRIAQLRALLGAGFPAAAVRAETLPQLIAALAGCHVMICTDGGAMHVAAGLGLPVVALFGDSDSVRWRPWGVPYRLLQKPSRQVEDIGVDEVAAAFNELRAGIPARARPAPP